MPGSEGGSDIFYCKKNLKGTWSKPENVGEKVNSKGNEYFPYVKNGILFFSSNVQRNQGRTDLDIYYINEKELLTKFPKPLDGLNSDVDDFAICFSKSDKVMEGYFTSNRKNTLKEDDDIYFFKFSNVDYIPNYDLIVQFTKEKEYLKSGTATLIDSEGNELEKTNIENGFTFNFNEIEKGKHYNLAYENEEFSGFFSIPINITEATLNLTLDIEKDAEFKDTMLVNNSTKLVYNLDSIKRFIAEVDTSNSDLIFIYNIDTTLFIKDTAILATVIAKKGIIKKDSKEEEVIKFNKKNTFDTIYFAFDSYSLHQISQDKLDTLIAYSRANKVNYIVLNAYTDSRGSFTYNQKLSIKRALACREYLKMNGIAESKIKYTGFGEKNLVNNCVNGVKCPENKHSQNRRIEITLLK
jgi:outer membrane protein OmpA-like peptidoglycan-associated protein